MSSPFVKIVDGKLQLFPLDLKETEVRILCILGKARMGKSTFLNAFVTQLEDIQPFQTQNNDEHCTRGIDYYFSEKERIVLMDCQGLALEDSSHDPALLLFAYLISDVIVFNERMMLQNEALKLLEPICTFMPYLEMNEQKPKLYFRISDGDMVTDVQKNLGKVIHTQYNDQYQTIRDSIQNLFQPEIGIVKTDSFDKKTKLKLQAGDYRCLLEEELGFPEAIQTLLASLPPGKSSGKWKQDVATYIDQINRNEKISIDKLDIVGQTGKIEILEWMNALQIYKEPTVDGTQADYDKWVEPLKREKQAILTRFTRMFKAIPDSVKKSHREKLNTLLMNPIANVEKTCEEKAELFVKEFVTEAQKDHEFPLLHSCDESFSRRPDTYFASYFAVFHRLLRACDHLYLPVKTKYTKWVRDQLSCFDIALDNVKVLEKGYIDAMKKSNEKVLTEYHQDVLTKIETIERDLLKKTPRNVIDEYYKQTTQLNIEHLLKMVKPHEIKVTMTFKVLKCYIYTSMSIPVIDFKTTFDKIAPLSKGAFPSNITFEEEKKARLEYLNGHIKRKDVLSREHTNYLQIHTSPDGKIDFTKVQRFQLTAEKDKIIRLKETDCLVKGQKSIQKEYDLIQEQTRQFEKSLMLFAFDKELEKAVTRRKNVLLEGEILSKDLVTFLSDVPLFTHSLGDQVITLTQDTYDKTYGPIHEETKNKLFTKGYISDIPWTKKVKDNHTTLTLVDVSHIRYLFRHQFYKLLAKHCVNGFVMPVTEDTIVLDEEDTLEEPSSDSSEEESEAPMKATKGRINIPSS
jgi:hypothetical protein